MNGKKPSRPINYRIYWLPLKAIEFRGVDTTSFLKNIVVLMYLFIFDDFFEVILLKEKNSIAVKKLYEIGKVLIEKIFFLIPSTLFSLNFSHSKHLVYSNFITYLLI